MIVYGDAVRMETARDKLHWLHEALRRARGLEGGILRHEQLAIALIEAGELAQALADRPAAEGDEAGPRLPALAMQLTCDIAQLVARSWRGELAAVPAELDASTALGAVALPNELTVKEPEGFAFYCLYPESYAEAARDLAGGQLGIVGIRSIGTTLSAMVAAGADAPCPITARPGGHPYGRTLGEADASAVCELTRRASAFSIVDEGPGASGSSVLAVADALRAAGAPGDALHVFPSHANGPGSQASPASRAFWNDATIHLRPFDDFVLASPDPAHRLESWVRDLTGPALGPLADISDGRWRAARYRDASEWPPVHPWQERRKFLLRAESGTWLLRFAGLGRTNAGKLERARALWEAGFAPQPLGYRHGFLVERWELHARPLGSEPGWRERLLPHLARYLGFRARAFDAGARRGASLEALWHMARINVTEGLGIRAADALDRARPDLPRLQAMVRPVETDNRLHAWEWLVTPDGRFLKTDALDHHAAHDLVGCQDIAWDIAGAVAELGLGAPESDDLAAAVGRETGRPVDPELLQTLSVCYQAFQLGYYVEAAGSTSDLPERQRLRLAAERYRDLLRRSLLKFL